MVVETGESVYRDWNLVAEGTKMTKELFKLYPDLQEAYEISQELSSVLSRSKDKRIAFKKLAIWYK